MKALQYDAYGVPPRLVQIEEPTCPVDGVLVRVEATGLCRSDWHSWQGHDPVELPQIPGHEYAGVVVAVGPTVRRWQVGDRVTAPFVLGCGACDYCLAGEAQVCPDQRQPGFTDQGSFAELVAVPVADFNLVRLPNAVDFATAASLGCRFATAYRALRVHARVAAGQWVLVVGCGGVGLSAVMIATALGARVIAIDLSAAALKRAGELGAEVVLDAADDAAVRAEVIAITGGGAHVGIDAIGHPNAARTSIHCLRRRGRHVQIGLLLGEDALTALPIDRVIALELELYGSHGMAAADYPGMLELVASGELRPDLLVSRVIGLADAADAFMAMGESAGAGITIVAPCGTGALGS